MKQTSKIFMYFLARKMFYASYDMMTLESLVCSYLFFEICLIKFQT